MREPQRFKKYLEQLGYSKTSILMLPSCLREFIGFINKPLEQITQQDIKAYHIYLQERPNQKRPGGLSESYINHHLYALKVYFSWKEELQELPLNPISGLRFKRPESSPREMASIQEIKLMYDACETLKERAVLGLFYGCGLRRTEGERLNLSDVHFATGLLYVREGKGSKRRVVPMSKKVITDLQNYIEKERKTKYQEPALICNQYGRRTKGVDLNKILKTILERAGLNSKISLHGLRHSIATHLLESGLSLEYVREFLGHKYLETTQIYTRVSNKQIISLSGL